jgi:hypothetical protein
VGAMQPSRTRSDGTVFPWMTSAYYHHYVRTTVEQSVRLSHLAGAAAAAAAAGRHRTGSGGAPSRHGRRRPAVFPFVWSKYEHSPGWPEGDPANASALLSAADAAIEFKLAYEAGADGLVWWGGQEALAPALTTPFWQHTATVTGPMVKTLMGSAQACASVHCGGHGRCVSLQPHPGRGGCVCDVGHPNCNTSAPRLRPPQI